MGWRNVKNMLNLPGDPGDAVGKLLVVTGNGRLDDSLLGSVEVVGNGVGDTSVRPKKSWIDFACINLNARQQN